MPSGANPTDLYMLEQGTGTVLVNVPHAGTHLPEGFAGRLSEAAARLPDTDWYVDRLYDFVPSLGAGLMTARYSRYLIDLNRPPDDAALYDSHSTGLLPLETFAGEALYRDGGGPGRGEADRRLEKYWRPYHAALQQELQRIRSDHGHAVLLDAHSIRSQVPLLFSGRLDDLNLGSNSGASAAPGLIEAAMEALRSQSMWTFVLDGRFRGGYITRQYGRPGSGVHALQLELAQSTYMNEDPPGLRGSGMQAMRGLLQSLLRALGEWRPDDRR